MAFTERYVSVAGAGAHDGTSAANAWTLAEAITAAPAAGTRVNVLKGTYANTTTSRALSLAGTTTAPIWWRGYDTTIGDIDLDPSLTRPQITFTTGTLTIGGTHQIVTCLDIAGAGATRQVLASGANLFVRRVRIENTNAAAGAQALTNSGVGNLFRGCWIKATSTAARVVANSTTVAYLGCVIDGGILGVDNTGGILQAQFNVFKNMSSHAVALSGVAAAFHVASNTFRTIGGDGLNIATLSSTVTYVVANNLFADVTGTAINNATGVDTNLIRCWANGFFNVGQQEAGMGDSPEFDTVVTALDPHTNAAGGDLSLTALSTMVAGGTPGPFENQTYRGYLDIGAVQRQGEDPTALVVRLL